MRTEFARILGKVILVVITALSGTLSRAADLSVPVALGWNLLGNTGTAAIDVASALGDGTKVSTVWKWNSQTSSWSFYAPALAASGILASYASGKSYEVLSSIGPGEGFWVNAVQAFTLSRPGIVPYSLSTSGVVKGWNLVATGDALSPPQIDSKLGGVAGTPSFSTMWAWSSAAKNWHFYAPALAASGGLAAYIQTKGYVDFGSLTTDNGLGFWLNSNVAGTSATDEYFLAPADPVNVAVTTETSNRVVMTLTSAGGTLSATDAAGNQFSLAIPANAVTQDTLIAMTPVGSLSGLPVTPPAFASVHLEPAGLFLEKDAILTIVPAQAVPVQNQTFFGAHGDGSDLSLAIPGPDYTQMQVRVPHFSLWGFLSMTPQERNAEVVLKRAADHAARLDQIIAKVMHEVRAASILGTTVDPSTGDINTLVGYFDSYYGLVVRPRLLVAATNCATAVLALQTLTTFNRRMQLLGGAGRADFAVELQKLLDAFLLLGKSRPCFYKGKASMIGGSLSAYANVTWTAQQEAGGVVTYVPSGTQWVLYPTPKGCTLSPEDGGSIDPASGKLTVDYNVQPPSYRGMALGSWMMTLTCPAKPSPLLVSIPAKVIYLGVDEIGEYQGTVKGTDIQDAGSSSSYTVEWNYKACYPAFQGGFCP